MTQKINPATDLEAYEVVIAMYPDKFDENSDDDIWDDVMDFIEDELGGDAFYELLGRLVLLTDPVRGFHAFTAEWMESSRRILIAREAD